MRIVSFLTILMLMSASAVRCDAELDHKSSVKPAQLPDRDEGLLCLVDALGGESSRIVLPCEASPSEVYAGAELARYVREITGAGFVSNSEYAVFIERGDDNLGPDGFRLLAKKDGLHISGGCRGILYGVYEVLERYGGVEWLSPRCTIVPKRPFFSVPKNLDERQKPAFGLRVALWRGAVSDADFAARLRLNGGAVGLAEHHGGKSHSFSGRLGNCHTFKTLLPVGKYGKDHPEYFALWGGVRLVQRKDPQLCLTNPDVLRIVTENVLEDIRRNPTARYFGVSQNDNVEYCKCEKCAAVDKDERSHSGTIIRFVNAVAESVEKEFPDKVIATLAYQYSRKPPAKTRPRKNVMPCLCSIECDFSHPIATGKDSRNVEFREDLKGWAPITERLYVWDYTTDFCHFPGVYPNFDALQANVAFFRDSGVTALFEQGDHVGYGAEFEDLKTWLLAKWMWNPDTDEKALLDRFFNGYYGCAAPIVRKYYDGLRTYPRKDGEFRLGCYSGMGARELIDDEFLVEARGLFDLAEKVAAGDSAEILRNVRYAAFSVDYMLFQRAKSACLKNGSFAVCRTRRAPIIDACAFRDAAQRLVKMMEENKEILLAEGKWDCMRREEIYDAAEGRLQFQPFVPCGRVVLEEDVFSLASEGVGCARVDDPSASQGKALKFFDNDFQWCAQLPLSKGVFDEGVPYRLRARVKIKRKKGFADHLAMNSGIYDSARGVDVRSWSWKADDFRDDEWQWLDLGFWMPSTSQVLWFSTGVFNHEKFAANPAVNAIFVDQIEISCAKNDCR